MAEPKHRNARNKGDPAALKQRWYLALTTVSLSFCGGLILFAAWVSQNYFETKSKTEKEYLERSQFLIEIGQVRAQAWQIEYNRLSKTDPKNRDSELYMTSMFNLIRSLSMLTAWEEARVSPPDAQRRAIAVKDMIIEQATELLRKQDVAGLEKTLRLVNDAKSKFQTQLDERFFNEIATRTSAAGFWNRVFLACYASGAIAIGLAWLLIHALGWPAKLHEQA